MKILEALAIERAILGEFKIAKCQEGSRGSGRRRWNVIHALDEQILIQGYRIAALKRIKEKT